MRKLFSRLHLWLSVPVGIFITVICLSGAALVFEQEIKQWLNRDIYVSNRHEGQKRLLPSEIATAVKSQVPDSLRISGLMVPGKEGLSYAVTFENMHRKSLYVNPYTGEVKGLERNYVFFTTMRQLHRWLMDVPPQKGEKTTGKMIVGISTLVMVLILVTGLVVWIPKNIRMLRQRLLVKTGKSRYRFWYDTHVSLGFYSTIFLLVMALTGLTWSFGWYRTAFYSAFGVEQQRQRPSARNSEQGKRKEYDFAVWDKAISEIGRRYTDYESVSLSASSARITLDGTGLRKQDIAKFNRTDGRIEQITVYAEQPRSSKMKSWIYAFHTGSWGGVTTKILYFIASIIGASLPLTGYYFWLKKKKSKKHILTKRYSAKK